MDVIPVIDLSRGRVVHARGGQRAAYQPIVTPLSPTSDPTDVVAGLLRLSPFRRLYVADLDAIQGQGDHTALLAGLAQTFPQVEIWLDNGARDPEGVARWRANAAGCLILGTESQPDATLLRGLRHDPRLVLSLDFRADRFQGPPEVLHDPSLWPDRIIVMTLARVGAAAGPDTALVAQTVRRAGRRAVYAAGGVRDAGDLHALNAAGAAGALVATALHGGSITAADLQSLARHDDRTSL